MYAYTPKQAPSQKFNRTFFLCHIIDDELHVEQTNKHFFYIQCDSLSFMFGFNEKEVEEERVRFRFRVKISLIKKEEKLFFYLFIVYTWCVMIV